MGREEHCCTTLGHLAQEVFDEAGRLGVEPHGRFIEHQHFRIVHQRRGQRGLLLHPVTVRIDRIIASSSQVEDAQQFIRALRNQFAVQVVQIADEAQQLASAQLGVQIGRIRDVAAGGLGKHRLGLDIVPGHFDRAGGGLQQSDDHLDGGGLPGSIRTEEAEHLTSVHIEADIIYGDLIAVKFDQVMSFDQGNCSIHIISSGSFVRQGKFILYTIKLSKIFDVCYIFVGAIILSTNSLKT